MSSELEQFLVKETELDLTENYRNRDLDHILPIEIVGCGGLYSKDQEIGLTRVICDVQQAQSSLSPSEYAQYKKDVNHKIANYFKKAGVKVPPCEIIGADENTVGIWLKESSDGHGERFRRLNKNGQLDMEVTSRPDRSLAVKIYDLPNVNIGAVNEVLEEKGKSTERFTIRVPAEMNKQETTNAVNSETGVEEIKRIVAGTQKPRASKLIDPPILSRSQDAAESNLDTSDRNLQRAIERGGRIPVYSELEKPNPLIDSPILDPRWP